MNDDQNQVPAADPVDPNAVPSVDGGTQTPPVVGGEEPMGAPAPMGDAPAGDTGAPVEAPAEEENPTGAPAA